MQSCRKIVLFFFLSAFSIAFGVSVRAETVEEKKAAANYDESLPTPQETQTIEEAPLASQVPVGEQTVPALNPANLPEENPSTLPKEEPAMIPDPSPMIIPVASPEISSQPAVEAVSTVSSGSSPAGTEIHPPVKVQTLPPAAQTASKEMPEAQVFTNVKPSGLVEVSGYKYPVFLFAPKDYKTDRTYAMIMIAPAESAKAEQQIEYLAGLAQRKSIFILAPYVLWPKAGDTPYALDEWLLTVKKDMIERFPISRKRVYLVGKDLGAHYAAYMAIKYPKEFTAVALLGQAWEGPFSQLVDPRSDAADQVPFYIALKAGGDVRSKNQVWFDRLQKKGYPLHFVEYKDDAELNDLEFKKSVFDWMEATGQSWEASVAQGQQTWKGKFKKGVKDFFAV